MPIKAEACTTTKTATRKDRNLFIVAVLLSVVLLGLMAANILSTTLTDDDEREMVLSVRTSKSKMLLRGSSVHRYSRKTERSARRSLSHQTNQTDHLYVIEYIRK